MAIKKINTDLQIEAGLLDGDGNSGSNNQILISTGTGIDWVNASTVIGGPYLPLSAGTSYPLTGVLYIAGTIRNNSGDLEIRNQTASGYATATKLKQQTVNGLETFLTLDGTSRNAYFTNQGNVGIGTAGPSATFVVQPSETSFNLAGLANGQIALGNNTSSGKAPTIGSRTTSTGQPPLQFITGQPNTSTVPGMIFSVREDNNSEFETIANKPAYDFTRYTTSLLRITRDGKVGIGNTSPSQKLEVTGGNVKADEYIYNATDRTSSKNWKYLAAVNAGTYRELGSWRATEGNVALRITVQSKTSANSGTAVYMFQGGFNQAEDGWYELVPAFKGGGHGNAQDGWKVLWYESTSYTFKIAVAVPTGLANKNLNVSIEYLGDTEGDSYYQYSALTTTGTIPTYSLERTTSYSNRNLVSSDSITAQYDATNYTILGYDYLDTYGGNQLFKVAGTERLRIDTSGNATFTGDILMPTAGQQLRIGSFTDGAINNGEYANDDLVIGDGSISIYPHRRGDYSLNESTATSTTFRSKLNIWSDNEDHITFGGASTHLVSAWESWKTWINNDSANNGTFYLYHTNAKTEFARFSGDGTTSFITGKFKATKELAVSSVATTNGSPATDNISVSGYGMIGNRGSVYLTNSSTDAAASIQIGVGGVHAASTKLLINPSNSIFSTNVRVGADSTYSLGTDANRWANVYADNFHGDGSNITGITAEWDGSHTGNASIDGDLTVTGTVTAQEFHTEFVSASILYESGSTKFGDTSDDNHDFTGSLNTKGAVNISGSLNFIGNGIGSLTAGDGLDEISLNVADDNDGGNPDNFNLSLDGNGQGTFYAKLLELGDGEGVENGTNITIDSTNSKILLDNGNVGIGTTSPGQKLHVVGEGKIQGNLMIGSSGDVAGAAGQLHIKGPNAQVIVLEDTDNANLVVRLSAEETVGFKIEDTTNSNVLFFGNETGNVGIGTTSPQANFHHKPSSSGLTFTNIEGTLIETGGSSNQYFALQVATAGGGKSFNVTNAGNVGIGTTSPSYKLDVNGTFRATGTGAIQGRLSVGTSSSSDIDMLRAGGNYITATNAAGVLHFRTVNDIRMTVANTGNVGIGTTNPSAKLEVQADVTANVDVVHFSNSNSVAKAKISLSANSSGELSLIDGNNNTDVFITSNGDSYFNGGDIGIGTTSPGTALQVGGLDDGSNYDITLGWNAVSSQAVGTKRSALTFKTSQTAVNNEDIYKWDIAMVTAPATAQNEPFGSNLAFLRSTRSSTSVDETTMILTQLGNVGIGTTTPSSKLEVYGSGSTVLDVQGSQGQLFSITDDLTGTLFAVSDISGVPIFAVEADGEVSIDGDLKIKSANITYQENIDVDSSAAETIATVNTGEYTGAFFDYTCVSGSNARVGTVMAISVGGSIEFTDNSTTDIGDTSGAVLSVDISGGSMRLRATTTTDDWIIKTLIRTL